MKDIKQLEALAKKQCEVFKKVKDKAMQIDLILNEIQLLWEFLFKSNPSVLPQYDCRYRHYVLSICSEFREDLMIISSIIFMKNTAKK